MRVVSGGKVAALSNGGGVCRPTDLARVRTPLWFDAMDAATLPADNNTVTDWINKGNCGAGNASQGTAAAKPLFLATGSAGKPGVKGRHDGTNGSLLRVVNHPSFATKAFHMFIVGNMTTLRGSTVQIGGIYTTAGNQRQYRSILSAGGEASAAVSGDGSTIQTLFNGAITVSVNTPFIIDLTYDPAWPQSKLTLNDSQKLVAAAPAQLFNSNAPFDMFAREVSSTESYEGFISELILCDDALTGFEREYVYNSLSSKWGI